MRIAIFFTATAAILTPSLAAYTCPANLDPINTPQCCRHVGDPDGNPQNLRCIDPSRVPNDFLDFRLICDKDLLSPFCCYTDEVERRICAVVLE
ncbi:hypothetical protein VF21_09735 [Pseudogymnoascus sp. 05NY08]|nr:hypothetical protein VF21_09735 [Pseudogymnoascus sp. 05NY08]